MNFKKVVPHSVRRLTALLLSFTLTVSLAGCSLLPGSGRASSKETKEQQRFDAFADEVFRSEIAMNIINLHFTLAHPENYGIEDYEVSLGDFSAQEDQESYDLLRDYIKDLKEFDYDLLTEEQKLTYDIFLTYAQDSLEQEGFRLYESYLTPTTGMQSYIPTLLAEYKFYREKDVQDYLKILELLPAYFEDLAVYAREQSEAGFFMPDFSVDKVIDQCRQFMEDPENHYLIDSFNLRLDETDFLEETQKDAYREDNARLMQECVFPAFTSLIEALEDLKGTSVNGRGLEAYDKGREYYSLLVRESTGSSKSVEEIEDLLMNQFDSDMRRLMELSLEDDTAFDRMEDCPVDLSDPYQVLNQLKTEIAADFPDNGQLPFEINYVPESMEEYTNPAYYILPPIDDLENNIIYINRTHLTENIEDFATLAHEGFPGHLFQTTYFYGKNPADIRKLFSFSGYSEGWGTYAEVYAYRLAGTDDTVRELNELNKSYTFILYCLADIGINYEGWTLDDTVSFFQTLGIPEDAANEVFEMMVEEPALYLSYYLGYLEFTELREKARETLGDSFNLKEFHTFLLDIGPAQFEIIGDRMDRWMEEQL